MEEMESKLGAILGNPEMMTQIMKIAQQLGSVQPQPQASPPVTPMPDGLDVGLLTKLAGVANSATIDNNQQNLLQALRPYLSQQRLDKLGKAMRAAKLANMASGLLGSGILSQIGG